MTWASDLGIVGDGATDCAPAFKAAIADAAVVNIEFGPGHYRLGSQVEQKSGMTIRGCGPSTIFSPLADFAFGLDGPHLTNGLISTAPDSRLVTISDLILDGLEIGHTGQAATRINGLVRRRTLGFLAERIVSRNHSGYAFLVSGADPTSSTDRHCSGVIQDCSASNSDVLCEIGMCRGVTVSRFRGDDGDGNIHAEDAFLAWDGAEEVAFEDISYSGVAGDGLKVLAIGGMATKGIVVRRAHIRMLGGTTALIGGYSSPGDAAFRNDILVEDSEFVSVVGNGVHLFNVDGVFRRSRLAGYNVGVGLESTADVLFEDTELVASNNPNASPMAQALLLQAGSAATVTRGAIRASGKNPVAINKNNAATLALSPQTILVPSP